MLAISDKIKYMYKRTYKKPYGTRTHKLNSLKGFINILLVLVVTSYMERFKGS